MRREGRWGPQDPDREVAELCGVVAWAKDGTGLTCNDSPALLRSRQRAKSGVARLERGGRRAGEDGAGGGWKGTSAGEGPRGVALGGEVLDAVVFIDLECDVLLLLVPQDDDLHGLALIGTQGALPVRGGVDAV